MERDNTVHAKAQSHKALFIPFCHNQKQFIYFFQKIINSCSSSSSSTALGDQSPNFCVVAIVS